MLSDTQTFVAPTALLPNGGFSRTLQRFYHDHQFWNVRTAVSNEGTLFGWKNRFTAGAEYNRTDLASLRQSAPSSVVGVVDPFNPAIGTFPTANSAYSVSNVNFDSRLKTASTFVEDALNIGPRWLVVGGLRYDHIDLERGVTNLSVTPNTVQSTHPRYHPLSWRLGTTYELNADTTLYAQYTTAAVPVSTILLQSIANTSFRLTKGRSVEAGFKANAFDKRMTVTGAAYYIQQDDILTRDPRNPSVAVQGGSQSSRGIELNLGAAVNRALLLNAYLGVVEAKYDELVEAGGAVLTGNRPINTPRTTAGVHGTYRIPDTALSLQASVRHVSGFYTDTANTIAVKGRSTLDAAVSWQAARNTTLTLRGRNLTNAFYGEYSGYPTTNVYLGAPRSFEIALLGRF